VSVEATTLTLPVTMKWALRLMFTAMQSVEAVAAGAAAGAAANIWSKGCRRRAFGTSGVCAVSPTTSGRPGSGTSAAWRWGLAFVVSYGQLEMSGLFTQQDSKVLLS
jgi:hypothetical protein